MHAKWFLSDNLPFVYSIEWLLETHTEISGFTLTTAVIVKLWCVTVVWIHRQLVNTIQEAVSSDAACRGLVVVTSDEARLTAFHKTFARVSKTAEVWLLLISHELNTFPCRSTQAFSVV